MTIILRLDPAFPPLWRSPDVLQFGSQAVVEVSPVDAWQLRLLHELAAGVPESAVMVWADILRVDPARVREFLGRLSPALLRVDPDLLAEPPRVVLHSPRAAADARMLAAVRTVCTDAGITVVETATTRGAPSAGDAGRASTILPAQGTADLAIVLAHHVVDPRTSAALLAAETTHLPVVITATGVQVGPLVVPGQTACLHCAELYRIDRDPSWPVLATQLLELVAPAPAPLVAIEAAAVIARFVAAATSGVATTGVATSDTSDRQLRASSVSVRAEGARHAWEEHLPHRSCQCLSLAQSATHPAAHDPQSETATTRALRVPA